jgi:hypothetical protein
MKSQKEEMTQRYLQLFKLDSQRLFERITERQNEYLMVFDNRRTRTHFADIFKNRMDTASMGELSHCSTDTIQALDQFYTLVDSMYWYLKVTEDMPGTVEENITRDIIRLKKLYDTLKLYLDAELGIAEENDSIPQLSETKFEDSPFSFQNDTPENFDLEKE